jgi:hypothetical protein
MKKTHACHKTKLKIKIVRKCSHSRQSRVHVCVYLQCIDAIRERENELRHTTLTMKTTVDVIMKCWSSFIREN